MKSKLKKKRIFEKLAFVITRFVGTAKAFSLAALLIVLWAATGPFFNYNSNWQLIINTSTTIITFLMVFIIQYSQNKDSISLHLKLNEIVASIPGASNRLINVEDLTHDELMVLQKYYGKLVLMSKKDEDIGKSHSVEEASAKHKIKMELSQKTINSHKNLNK